MKKQKPKETPSNDAKAALVFAAVVHELRAPLSRVAFPLYDLKKQCPKQAQNLAQIEREFSTMQKRIGQFGQIAELLLGEALLEKTRVHILKLAQDCVEKVTHTTPTEKRLIEIASPEEGVTIETNEALLKRIFEQLIQNAIAHGAKNGLIKIDIETEAKMRGVFFSISNDGEALDDADIARFFEPFYSTKPAGEDGMKPMGLGLFFVAFACERLGIRPLAKPRRKGGVTIQLAWEKD